MSEMFRCVNDRWGYCGGTPDCEWQRDLEGRTIEPKMPATPCGNDAKSCKWYQSWREVAAR
jgi:hypothetical protein